MNLPFISCICPTYKRPNLLFNVMACFAAQDYPADRCELIILDDANQYDPITKGNITMVSTDVRYSCLPSKFNHLVSLTKGDVIAIWEDDDIFLPWHLNAVAHCHINSEKEFYVSKNVWSTYEQKFGDVLLEDATGRFHSSWRFTRNLFDSIGGYPQTNELSFDQIFGGKLKKASSGASYYGEALRPSYVYRWGNGYWHGSQHGDNGFKTLWDYVGSLPSEHQGLAEPQFDEETRKIFNHFHD